MAKSGSIRIKGLDSLIKKVERMPAAIRKEVAMELDAAALEIDREAKRLAPKDNAGGGGLAGRFYIEKPSELKRNIGNSSEYAAYQEFGTGVHAAEYVTTLPENWQEYARSFFVNGKGRVPAHPFLFPAFENTRPKLIKRITTILEDEK